MGLRALLLRLKKSVPSAEFRARHLGFGLLRTSVPILPHQRNDSELRFDGLFWGGIILWGDAASDTINCMRSNEIQGFMIILLKIFMFYNTFALTLYTLAWAIILDPVVLRLFWGGGYSAQVGVMCVGQKTKTPFYFKHLFLSFRYVLACLHGLLCMEMTLSIICEGYTSYSII